MQLAPGQNHTFGHAAVHHHAQHLEILAAIRVAFATREAVAAIHIRLHRTAVGRLHVGYVRAHGEHFDAEFVARNAWVAEEGHLAEVA
jgi:hypothetical protein